MAGLGVIEVRYDPELIGGPPTEHKDRFTPPNGAIPIVCGSGQG
jgi:hypothetical protein